MYFFPDRENMDAMVEKIKHYFGKQVTKINVLKILL
jgi:hypothetical protein